MKFNTKLILLLSAMTLSLTSLSAETTMCFKENHKNFSTIDQAKLDGGMCLGTKTANEMKKEGWTVDDIKINGSNYIYIFKKQTTLSTVNMAELERKVLEKLAIRDKEAKEAAKVEMRRQKSLSGQRIYINKCQNCHGEKGEAPYGTSRPINDLNLDDFLTTIRDYGLGEYDRGQAFVMTPYAIGKNDAQNVYVYLQSLKPIKKEPTAQKEK